ncbi:MAG: hypothetical protein GWN55_00295, partial [Phycisphaerae bacterium]|nr:hypothetical protein [Phycisphaerae bacterium]
MAGEERNETPGTTQRINKWLPWFIGGGALSFFVFCSFVLFILVIFSLGLNAYLAWQLSGLEIVIVRPMPISEQAEAGAPANTLITVATATLTPQPTSTPEPTSPPTPTPSATPTATATATITPIDTDTTGSRLVSPTAAATTAGTAIDPTVTRSLSRANQQSAPATSTNTYILIPIEGGRDSRPAEEHGDLNLKLRDPEPSQASAELVDYTGYDDPNAPKLSAIFEPDFVATYVVHDWDWNCNCKGKLKNEGFLVGIETTPGEPIYIPPTQQAVWQDDYYAVVLYASEDSLTFVYNRVGTVAHD